MRPCGFVYIIESPSEDDLLDGRTEGKTLTESLHLSNIKGRYSLVTSRQSLEKALTSRFYEAINTFPNDPPIFHFSMHGNRQGIALTNGEFVSWAELWKFLEPINDALSGGLLICMSSCSGSFGSIMAMDQTIKKPFWALIGNTQEAEWSDAAVAYVTFYHLIFKNVALDRAVQIMKDASGDSV